MNGPEPGLEILPGLTLLRRLGRGGMGEAWLARDAERDTPVVAKLLPADAPVEKLALLRREARLVRKLSHPHIVPVYGFRAGSHFCAVTQQHMPGGDAGGLRGAAPVELVRVARDVADALAYLHELGVVHRDVKAGNVLLDDAGRARLADFGIAAVASGDEDGIVVRGGGSKASMSPQQRAGAPAQPADDLYALGVLLLDLLSGEVEPGEQGLAEVARQRLATPRVPQRLRGLVAALLEATAEARPRSAGAVRDELDAILLELARDAPARDPLPVRLQPPPRVGAAPPVLAQQAAGAELFATRAGERRPAAPLLLGVLVLLAIASVVWLPRWAKAPVVTHASPSPSPAQAAPVPAPAEAPAGAPERASSESPGSEARAEPSVEAEAQPGPEAGREPSGPRRGATAVAAAPSEPASAAEPEPRPEPTPDRAAEARALASHRDEGARLEASEDWRGALRQYEAALAIDAQLSFALEGRERAERRARLDEALDFHLERRDRLSAPAVAREAEAVLERARGVQPPGPALEARIVALEAALARAGTRVAVVIESDGLTELTLSRVGRLGTLTRRSVELLPGTYTVTGSRRGYRDVRRQFSVLAGAPGPTVSLRCEESL